VKHILLSILTPSVPGRLESVTKLVRNLHGQIADRPVEHLVFIDNKRRTIGAKRQTLLEMARGDYLVFVDDDDHVAEDYVTRVLQEIAPIMTFIVREDGTGSTSKAQPPPDLIVYPIHVRINGEQDGIVEPSIKYVPKNPGDPLEPYCPPVTCRPPHELCVWRRAIALRGEFPDISGGEDFIWARQLWPLVKVERRIDKVLYFYETWINRREH